VPGNPGQGLRQGHPADPGHRGIWRQPVPSLAFVPIRPRRKRVHPRPAHFSHVVSFGNDDVPRNDGMRVKPE
jgi:hypothetical protein